MPEKNQFNSMRNMTDSSYEDFKFDKYAELNSQMSIDSNKSFDEFGRATRSPKRNQSTSEGGNE